ncbi:hypothetical protein SDC9_156141 [bioreactor metagenome]|uniref:Uncharacterized protein n=1 Tax=bioreactor metagenome TaxID=1076179 RepID=A0A645F3E6_9ZZZZ
MNLLVCRGDILRDRRFERGLEGFVGILLHHIGAETVNIHLHARGVELLLEDLERTRFYIGCPFTLRLRTEGIHVVLHLVFHLFVNLRLLVRRQRNAHRLCFV